MSGWELFDGERTHGPFTEAAVLEMIGRGMKPTTMVRARGAEAWAGLRAHAPFAFALERLGTQSQPIAAAPQTPIAARRVEKNDFIGKGCLVQGAGFLLPFVGFFAAGIVGCGVGLIACLGLLIAGGRMAKTWSCGACGNALADGDVRLCGVCRAPLS